MWGAGKRKTRNPARFSDFTDDPDLADDFSHDSDALSSHSSRHSRSGLREHMERELQNMSKDLEELKLDIQRTKDDRTTPKEPLARQSSGHKRSSSPSSQRLSRISAAVLRDFRKMAGDVTKHANSSPPPSHRSRRQSRKLHSSPEFSSTSSSSDRSVSSDTSYGGKPSRSRSSKKKKSMKSGLHRKATDSVKCRVIYPQERLPVTEAGAVKYHDMEWHQFLYGSMDIIISADVSRAERKQRQKILRFLMLEVPEFGYKSILDFNAHIFGMVERKELHWTDRKFMKKGPGDKITAFTAAFRAQGWIEQFESISEKIPAYDMQGI
ncbi:hypothetical protein Bbelb_317010 [Branchiostoma belcheri]|nr:hypothetical protein Bbelb_317010 [Branchiostoma belcheri]